MGDKTSIEWTSTLNPDGTVTPGSSWNPVTGCTQVSPGCDHCYALTFAERFRGVPGSPYEQGFDLKLWPERLELPLRWKRPRKIFVNSMSDLFHQDVPDDFILQVFTTMIRGWEHTYQVLTKRPSRLVNTTLTMKILDLARSITGKWAWPQQIWLGVSVENQDYTWRVDKLLQVPAPVRFISAEPLLGALDLRKWLRCCPSCGYPRPEREYDSCGYCEAYPEVRGISWLIVGAESGHGARPMQVAWARSLRDQAGEAGVKFFLKQYATPAGKKIPLPELDGRIWNEYPS